MDGRQVAGTILISIDLELEIDHYCCREQSRLDLVRDRLVDLFRQSQLPATWSVADPARSAASDAILAGGNGHEIAVLGDRTWIGTGAGAARMMRELARRFNGARRVGMNVSTLALRNCAIPASVAPLVAHGITAVRGPAVESAAEARRRCWLPTADLWHAPTPWQLPLEKPWGVLIAWHIRREIERAVRERATLHLEINAQNLLDAGRAPWRLLASIAAMLAAHRQNGALTVRTLGSLAADSLRKRARVPAHSVLRPAA